MAALKTRDGVVRGGGESWGGYELGVGKGHSESTTGGQQGLGHLVWAIPAFVQLSFLPSLAYLQ